MAINFEAANMAGYNNPKIEVFTLTLDQEGGISAWPSKSEIINCIQRGSLPFLFIDAPEMLTSWILPLSLISIESSGNPELSFSTVSRDSSGAFSATSIFYPETSDTPPTLSFRELQ